MGHKQSSIPVFVFLSFLVIVPLAYAFLIVPHQRISTERFANLVVRAARLEEVGDTSAKTYLQNRLVSNNMWLSERDAKDCDTMMEAREKDVLAKLYLINGIRTKHEPKQAEKPDRAA